MAQRYAVNLDKVWLCWNGTEKCSSLASCTSERLRWVRKQMCGISVLTQVSMKCCSLSTRLHHQKGAWPILNWKLGWLQNPPRTFFMSVLFIFRRKVMNKLIKTSPTTKQRVVLYIFCTYMGKFENHHTPSHMYVVRYVYSNYADQTVTTFGVWEEHEYLTQRESGPQSIFSPPCLRVVASDWTDQGSALNMGFSEQMGQADGSGLTHKKTIGWHLHFVNHIPLSDMYRKEK